MPLYRELRLTGVPGRVQRDLVETFDPDVVHCATESVLGWWGRRWALTGNRPLLTSFHTNFPAYTSEYGIGFCRPLVWSLLRRFHEPARATLCP
ncbi:MAG: glycosyltransferase, partial [bacterium]